VNVAERALFLASTEQINIPFDFPGMADKVQSMLKRSLDSLVNLDIQLARQVCADDDEVDAINRKMYAQVKDGIRAHPEWLDALIHSLGISRHLERIADLATNIAEDVIYMAEGEIVRHKVESYHAWHEEPGDTSTGEE
jgi:phosphate transport system protein